MGYNHSLYTKTEAKRISGCKTFCENFLVYEFLLLYEYDLTFNITIVNFKYKKTVIMANTKEKHTTIHYQFSMTC